MTDRELLEAAARAAGVTDLRWFEPTESFVRGRFTDWNPLTDDGDALRLAVKLDIDVLANTGSCVGWTRTVSAVHVSDKAEVMIAEGADYDPYAATRRAIVRAAAAIGAGMIDDSTAAHS